MFLGSGRSWIRIAAVGQPSGFATPEEGTRARKYSAQKSLQLTGLDVFSPSVRTWLLLMTEEKARDGVPVSGSLYEIPLPGLRVLLRWNHKCPYYYPSNKMRIQDVNI